MVRQRKDKKSIKTEYPAVRLAHDAVRLAHHAVRLAHSVERAQDYCETVLELINETGVAHVTALAERLGVSHVTAIRVVQRLGREGFFVLAPYKSIKLSKQGTLVAKKAAMRHRIVYEFLRKLGVSHKNACRDAEGMEHHVGEETLRCFKLSLRREV